MELKSYQHKVIKDLELYLEYVQRFKKTDTAFNKFWVDRIGPYNALNGEGMQPYKNTIPKAAHVCIKVPTAGGKTFIACNALRTIFSANKSHCFQDGNKRIAITLGSIFLLKNGYINAAKEFLYRMEIISYHVAASNIDKELLLEIITSILNEEDYSEELKLNIACAISQNGEDQENMNQ